MRLIHNNKRHPDRAQFLYKTFIPQTLRRHIQKFCAPVHKFLASQSHLPSVHSGMKAHRLYPSPLQVINLILHKRDEWRYDNSDTGKSESRNLKRY